MKVMFSGSRNFTHWDVVEKIIQDHVPAGSVVLHGHCPTGVDLMVDRLAPKYYCSVVRFPADWESKGKGAGPQRNREMLLCGPERIICIHEDFQNSKGTKDVFTTALTTMVRKHLLLFDGKGNLLEEYND